MNPVHLRDLALRLDRSGEAFLARIPESVEKEEFSAIVQEAVEELFQCADDAHEVAGLLHFNARNHRSVTWRSRARDWAIGGLSIAIIAALVGGPIITLFQ